MTDLSIQKLDGAKPPYAVLEGESDEEWLASTEMVHLGDYV